MDMTVIRISSTELARSVGDILNRIRYRGESFVIERNGKTVALLAPHPEPVPKTLREVLGPWAEGAAKDPDFPDLLEELGRRDRPLEDPWESS